MSARRAPATSALVALGLAVVLGLLGGCATRGHAPVIDRMSPPGAPAVETPPLPAAEAPAEKPLPTHTVKRGDTLVSIALQYGLDYRELAAWNGITNPNVISVGQVLVLAALPGAAPVAPITTPLAAPGPPIEARPLANTANAKVEPRAQKLPFSEKALAQLSAPDGSGAPGAAIPPPAPEAPRALEERILERVLERTGVRAREVHLLAPGTLPRTSSGKLRRAEALRQLQEGSLLAPRAVTFLGMAREAARSMAAFARLRMRS